MDRPFLYEVAGTVIDTMGGAFPEIVAPREPNFDIVDWGMLMQEWKRLEQRLRPPTDEEEAI